MLPPVLQSALLRFAELIAPDGLGAMRSEQGAVQAAGIVRLLGAAYPALQPSEGWQLDACAQLELEGWGRARSLSELRSRVRAQCQGFDELGALRDAARRLAWYERSRIALRELLPPELGGAPIAVTSAELSYLACALLELFVEEALVAARVRGEPSAGVVAPRARSAPWVVLGLGKLAAGELNPGSDVDLMFLCDAEPEDDCALEQANWSARRLVESFEALTSAGRLWPVDLRLRPEGSRGPLVPSLVAVERYYETQGRFWERVALLRSRRVAGNVMLGARFMREVATPFVYRRVVEPAIAGPILELVERSRAELSREPARDLKHGPGGIRQAEFFVQALQLIWGGRDPSLRVTGTLEAMERLCSAGRLSERERLSVGRAYTLLRLVEHRVQWASGVRTHLVPRSAEDQFRLARSLGWSSPQQLNGEILAAREVIDGAWRELLPSSAARGSRHLSLVTLLHRCARNPPHQRESLGSSELSELLGRSGFSGLESGMARELFEQLVQLARLPDGLLGERTCERFARHAERVLDALAQSAEPLLAARSLAELLLRVRVPGPYVAALGESPAGLARLISTLGYSAFVGESLQRLPELFERLLVNGGRIESPEHAYRRESTLLTAAASQAERDEEFMASLRRAKLRTAVSVATAELTGQLAVRDARSVLSDLADAQLRAAAQYASGGELEGFMVLALGKLGGSDLGYGSDLDVVFVYDAAPNVEAQAHFTRLAQRLLRLVGAAHPAGPGYSLDTRLRPSGAEGMLVTSLAAFARYHGLEPQGRGGGEMPPWGAHSAPWERQALIRARFCTGDAQLGERVLALCTAAAYQLGAPLPSEVRRLRYRLQNERANERGTRRDFKLGYGGLLDVELCVQWLQMTHGQERLLRTADTGRALTALRSLGYLAPEDFEVLREGYEFLRHLEQRLSVLDGVGGSWVDESSPGYARLARSLGYFDLPAASAAAALRGRYAAVTQAVRHCFERLLAGAR